MKRFKLQSGHVIKVDDADAYLLRGKVWSGSGMARSLIVSSRCSSMAHRVLLSHYLMGAKDGDYVRHLNGDQADFTRANLRVTSKAEFYRQLTAEKKLVGMAKALA